MDAMHSSLLNTVDLAAAGVSPLALLSGIGMIMVALAFAAYAVRCQLGWCALALGALAWSVTVALKFAWALPCNPPIYTALHQTMSSFCDPLFMVYVGALTGVFEVGLVAVLLYSTRLGQSAWPGALAFGIGFGAMEALFFGVASLSSTLVSMLISLLYPPTPEVAARLANLLWVIAPVVERLAAIFIHTCANVLIFYAVKTREVRWFWLAFACKTLVDAFAAAFVHMVGVDTLARGWTFEGMMILFGLAAWLGLRWLAPRYRALPSQAAQARLAHGAA